MIEKLIEVLTDEQHHAASENNYNFDHPDAFDFDLLLETLNNLKMGKQVCRRLINFFAMNEFLLRLIYLFIISQLILVNLIQ